jgi:hypothetical protein
MAESCRATQLVVDEDAMTGKHIDSVPRASPISVSSESSSKDSSTQAQQQQQQQQQLKESLYVKEEGVNDKCSESSSRGNLHTNEAQNKTTTNEGPKIDSERRVAQAQHATIEGRQRSVAQLVAYLEKQPSFSRSRYQVAVPDMIVVNNDPHNDEASDGSTLTMPKEFGRKINARVSRTRSEPRNIKDIKSQSSEQKKLDIPRALRHHQSFSRRRQRKVKAKEEEEEKSRSHQSTHQRRRLYSDPTFPFSNQVQSAKKEWLECLGPEPWGCDGTESDDEDDDNEQQQYSDNTCSSNSSDDDDDNTHHSDKTCRARGMALAFTIGRRSERGWYSGFLKGDIPSGTGVIRFQNGDLYMGDMKNGEMHGKGTLVSQDEVLQGDFEHNLYVV